MQVLQALKLNIFRGKGGRQDEQGKQLGKKEEKVVAANATEAEGTGGEWEEMKLREVKVKIMSSLVGMVRTLSFTLSNSGSHQRVLSRGGT